MKYDIRMQEKELQLQEAHKEMFEKVQVHEIIKAQIEDDTDREIVDLRTSYETKLFDERQAILKLKGEAGVLRNKQKVCQKEVEDLKWQLNNLRDEYTQLTARKEELEKSVVDLKDDLSGKESTIADREKRVSKLERDNQELEKFKFVLNERINELMSEIEPRDKKIVELKEKVADMETELLGLNKTRQDLDLKQHELKGKLSAWKKELDKEEQRRKRYQQLLRKIRIDLLEAVGLIQEPMALKNCVIKLFRRYSDVELFLRNHKADMDAQCEFTKQRGHLERTIAILKKQLAQGKPDLEAQLDKLLDDNVMLLGELKTLREELKNAQSHIADTESRLGLRVRDVTPSEVRAKLGKACHANERMEQAYQLQIKECQRIIDVLKEDIDRLTGQQANQPFQTYK
jgi:chromosome segregation ATPase